MLYGSSTWQTENFETFLSVLCLPFRPSHSVFHTRCSPWLNLPFTAAFIAPSSISLKTVAIHLTSSIAILPPSQKAILPATQSCLLPPLWPSCSQAAKVWSCPPPRPSCSFPDGTTYAATTPATLTPPGSTTGKAASQAIGRHQAATSTGPATKRAALTPLGFIPGRATGPSGKAKEAAQASMISRRTMARSLKAATAATQAAKDRQFRAFQEELGLSLDDDGEASAPSTPQRTATWCPVARSPQQGDGGDRANELPRLSRTPPPWSRFPPYPLICRRWFLTLLAQRARTQGVPNCRCLWARRALHTLNPLPAG